MLTDHMTCALDYSGLFCVGNKTRNKANLVLITIQSNSCRQKKEKKPPKNKGTKTIKYLTMTSKVFLQ